MVKSNRLKDNKSKGLSVKEREHIINSIQEHKQLLEAIGRL